MKLKHLLAKIFGRKYFIKEVEWLEDGEIQIFFHNIYIRRNEK